MFYQEPKKTHHLSENIILILTDDDVIFDGDYKMLASEMNQMKPVITGKIIGPELELDDFSPAGCDNLRDFAGALTSSVCVTSDAGKQEQKILIPGWLITNRTT